VNPAFSVVLFTTLAGAGQGLVVALAGATLLGVPMSARLFGTALIVAEALLAVALAASFAHLGRPERAWRAVLMWRTSWLSRECIAFPAFMAVVAGWALAARSGSDRMWWAWVAIAMAVVLWCCTAMIYACLRFVQEWAQPLTPACFVLIGLSSGALVLSALAALTRDAALLASVGPFALGATLAAWLARALMLRHNASLRPRSTLQSATGIRADVLVQTSMGMSAGSFNTREFFHGRTPGVLRHVKFGFVTFGFAAPAAAALWGLCGGGTAAWVLAVLLQAPGLLAERWFFFAQARHPQNLYYQVVS
jgi:DMSO reductase anchor subunit